MKDKSEFKASIDSSTRTQFIWLYLVAYAVSSIALFYGLQAFYTSYLRGLVNSHNYSIAIQEWRQVANGILSGWFLTPDIKTICVFKDGLSLFSIGNCSTDNLPSILSGTQLLVLSETVKIQTGLSFSIWILALILPILVATPIVIIFFLLKKPITRKAQNEILAFLKFYDEQAENLTIFETEMKRQTDEIIGLKRQAAIAEVAAQVAHDIRSPLSALRIGLTKLQDVQAKELCNHAIQRIQDTLAAILVKNQGGADGLAIAIKALEPFDLVSESRKILQTKQLETSVAVDFSTEMQICQVFGNASHWGNILSNLINNSIDAHASQDPKISISITRVADFIRVSVKDQGKGMSKELVRRMMTNPTSHGKESSPTSGYGLGLRGAQAELLKWNCSMNIQSAEGVGTTVSILFPAGGDLNPNAGHH